MEYGMGLCVHVCGVGVGGQGVGPSLSLLLVHYPEFTAGPSVRGQGGVACWWLLEELTNHGAA